MRLRGLAVAAAFACGLPFASAPAASAAADPVGAHSMLQLNSPYSFMQSMFAEAAGMHASAIRLDVAPALIFQSRSAPPDYTGLDEVMALAQQYDLRVVADLFTVPPWLANCQVATDQSGSVRCGTDDLSDYGSEISQIVSHADPVIRDWEVWNEPDTRQYFTGTPAQYARMLRSAHDAIKQVDPQANVLLGGISSPAGAGWLNQVFATPGADAAHAFDVANVHQRGPLDSLASSIAGWRQYLAGHGFTGPLWVTEHGYPSDPRYQYDPAFAGGPASQAAYLAASIPTLVDAGASEVFVTERDNLSGPYASEGVLGGTVSDPPTSDPQVVEKPSYSALTTVAECYVLLGRDCPGAPPAAAPLAIPATRLGGSTTSTVTVSDPGPAPLQLGAATLAPGASAALTIQQDACPGILEPAQTCKLQVRFRPSAGGLAAATVSVPSDSGSLELPVTGVSPSVSSLVARRLPVAKPARGKRGPSRMTFSFANPLPASVHIGGTLLAGPGSGGLRVSANRCAGSRLRPGRSCQVSVVLLSGTGGARARLMLRGDGKPLSVPLF